jgi:hypothetical protein
MDKGCIFAIVFGRKRSSLILNLNCYPSIWIDGPRKMARCVQKSG